MSGISGNVHDGDEEAHDFSNNHINKRDVTGDGDNNLYKENNPHSDTTCAHHSWCHWRLRGCAGGKSM